MSGHADDDRRHSAVRHIKAPPCAIYNVFIRPQDLVRWMPPQGAVGRIEAFEPREGGRLRMILTFANAPGKTSSNSDVVEARFARLQPDEMIVLDVEFASDRPEFVGTMTITWSLSARADGTDVSVVAERVPAASLSIHGEAYERHQTCEVISDISSQQVISHDECPVLTDKTCPSPACQPHRRFADVPVQR
jgi:uncharacterized protein YndB with AHSA1/START domain